MEYLDVADNIVDYFSEDARYCWPCRSGVAEGEPSRVYFKFATEEHYVKILRGRIEVTKMLLIKSV